MKTRTTILLAFLFCLSSLTAGAQPTPTPPSPTPMQGQDQQRISVLEWEHKAHQASRELMKFQLREAEKLNAKADIEAIQAEYAKAGERMIEIQKEYKRITEAQKMREQAEKAKKPGTEASVVPGPDPNIPTPPKPEGVH